MTMNERAPVATVPASAGFGWRRLALGAGAVAAGGHLLLAAAFRDLDPLFVAVGFVVALGLTRVRRGAIGWALLVLSFANIAFWTVSATVSNLAGPGGFLAVALPATMAVLSAVGLVAAVAVLLRRTDPHAGAFGAPLTAVAGGVVLLALLLGAALGSGPGTVVPPDAEVLVADRTAFSSGELTVVAGEVTVALENRDYFWHTFTVPDLGVDLRVPVGATGTATFLAGPGRYEFVCAIPGHERAGMTGVLLVERQP